MNINLMKKPEWFVNDINPIGKVPVIQMDDKIVYESGIVCEYVDTLFPGETLTPDDPYKKALDKMLLERFSKVQTSVRNLFSVFVTAMILFTNTC